MDRAETTGLGVALVGHGGLLYVLIAGIAANRQPPPPSDPIQVSFVGPVAPVSAAPTPQASAPSPAPAPSLSEPTPAKALPEPPPRAQPLSKAGELPRPRADPPRPQPQPKADDRRVNDRRKGRLDNIAKDLSDGEPTGRSSGQPAAVMNAQAAAGIAGLIRRQVQPCANRMVSPGPGANRIKVTINLRLNRDGSLAAPPRTIAESGLDNENRRYLQRVKELAISAFTSCSPLRGLPPELYAVRNGWNDFDMNYNLP
jgi:hypothetical protein